MRLPKDRGGEWDVINPGRPWFKVGNWRIFARANGESGHAMPSGKRARGGSTWLCYQNGTVGFSDPERLPAKVKARLRAVCRVAER
jgi:hypothetical protein